MSTPFHLPLKGDPHFKGEVKVDPPGAIILAGYLSCSIYNRPKKKMFSNEVFWNKEFPQKKHINLL